MIKQYEGFAKKEKEGLVYHKISVTYQYMLLCKI